MRLLMLGWDPGSRGRRPPPNPEGFFRMYYKYSTSVGPLGVSRTPQFSFLNLSNLADRILQAVGTSFRYANGTAGSILRKGFVPSFIQTCSKISFNTQPCACIFQNKREAGLKYGDPIWGLAICFTLKRNRKWRLREEAGADFNSC